MGYRSTTFIVLLPVGSSWNASGFSVCSKSMRWMKNKAGGDKPSFEMRYLAET